MEKAWRKFTERSICSGSVELCSSAFLILQEFLLGISQVSSESSRRTWITLNPIRRWNGLFVWQIEEYLQSFFCFTMGKIRIKHWKFPIRIRHWNIDGPGNSLGELNSILFFVFVNSTFNLSKGFKFQLFVSTGNAPKKFHLSISWREWSSLQTPPCKKKNLSFDDGSVPTAVKAHLLMPTSISLVSTYVLCSQKALGFQFPSQPLVWLALLLYFRTYLSTYLPTNPHAPTFQCWLVIEFFWNPIDNIY